MKKVPKRLLKIKEVCQYLSLSPWKVRKLVVDGVIPFIQLEDRGPWLIDMADLEAFIQKTKKTY